MPEISRFFGIVIKIHYADHNPPHFHAEYAGKKVEIEIKTLAVLEGDIQGRALGMVMEWARQHTSELAECWRRARGGEKPGKIAPLE